MTPASIRNKNPGAQYPGKSSRAFGSRTHEVIGGGHKIATFETYEQGAAALFHLLDRVYKGMMIADAIKKWSGNNQVNSYLNVIESRSPFKRTDYIDGEMIETPAEAIAFAQAMAFHEAGRPYPMSDAQWKQSHELFMSVKKGKPLTEMEKATQPPAVEPLQWAIDKIGEREIPGREHNPFVVWCFKTVGSNTITDDETPWCAAFVGAALKETGYHYLHNDFLARSYLKYGTKIYEPEIGALVITKRGTSTWQGHVAFISDVTEEHIKFVGGNQNNAVNEQTISRRDSSILGFRRPVRAHHKARDIIKKKSVRYKTVGILSTLSALVWSGWNSIVDGIATATDFVAVSIGALPQAAIEAERASNAANKISEAGGLPWPATIALIVTLLATSFNLYSTWERYRDRQEREDDN